MWMKYQSKYENTVYAVLWGLLFAAPVLSVYIRMVNDPYVVFNWSEVLLVWRRFTIYLGLFLIHNFLLAPLLIHGRKRWLYFSAVTLIIAAFAVYQCTTKPYAMGLMPRQAFEHREAPQHDDFRPMPRGGEEFPQEPRGRRDSRIGRGHRPPVFIGEREIVAIVVIILMFGANLGIKYYFRSRDDRKRLQALEKQNLEQQLEYLRYQINPHFFMNTLNNIHALVDIDPEKAKDTILELSKMMRFVLYEGNKQGVPLDREMAFLQNYITLMKLRYTDKVSITIDVPASLPNKEVPPLMFITFVENAFKHGVSYRQESFIHIEVKADDNQLIFTCRNSRIPKEEDKHGGVGLSNVKQRLDLIYGDRYSLDIKDQTDTYTVILTLPL